MKNSVVSDQDFSLSINTLIGKGSDSDSQYNSDYHDEAPISDEVIIGKKVNYPEKNRAKNLFKCLVISYGGSYMGYYLTVFNPMGSPLLKKVYKVSEDDYASIIGNINLIFSLAIVVCCLVSGPLANKIGRFNMLLIGEILALISYYFYTIQSIHFLYLARLLSGIVVGFNTSSV
jgi:MFS family permease